MLFIHQSHEDGRLDLGISWSDIIAKVQQFVGEQGQVIGSSVTRHLSYCSVQQCRKRVTFVERLTKIINDAWRLWIHSAVEVWQNRI